MATHHTPLRRISHGSLHQSHTSDGGLVNSASRRPSSGGGGGPLDGGPYFSPTGLDFLHDPLLDLVDEIETLGENVRGLNGLSRSLAVFNEGFAGFLYGLRMNAFSVEWPQAPTDLSFALHDQAATAQREAAQQEAAAAALLAQQHQASASLLASSATPRPTPSSPNSSTYDPSADATYATIRSSHLTRSGENDDDDAPTKRAGTGIARGRGGTTGIARGRGRGRGGATAGAGGIAARKKREAQVAAIVETLPLEFRGQQPALRTAMEKVLSALLVNHPAGIKVADLANPQQDLPPTRVNKCLLALVNKKIVRKASEGGVAVYVYTG